MRITRVQINNLYNLKNVDVDLRNPTALFVGPNGSGKTNIIKCIQLVQQAFSRENPKEFLREVNEPLKGLQDCHGEEAYVRIQAWLGKTDKQILLDIRILDTITFVTDLAYRILELLWRSMNASYYKFLGAKPEDELRNDIRKDDMFRNLPDSYFNVMFSSLHNFPSHLFEELLKFFPPKLLNGFRTCQSHNSLSDEKFNCGTRSTHDVNVAIEFNPFWNDYLFRYGDPTEISLSDSLHIPCNTEEEKRLILKLLDEIFGDVQRLGIQFKLPEYRKPEPECFGKLFEGKDAVGVDDVVQWLLDPSNFGNTFSLISQLQLNFSESSPSLQIDPHEVGEIIFKVVESSTGSNRKMNAFFSFCLKKFRIKYDSPKDLHEQMNKTSCLRAILADLFSSSIQVLPQDRGLFDQQPHSSLLVASKTESRLIQWKLSGDSYKQNQFKKVEDALGSLGGLKLDVDSVGSTTSPEETGQKEAKRQKMSDQSQSNFRLMVTRNVAQSTSTVYKKTIQFRDCSGGEIELMMVWAAVHLTDADTVFLDEPGHSFHPPQQAQLRRWLEEQRNPGQVLVIVTHAIEMISPTSLKAIYHMAFTGAGFTPFRLRELNKGMTPAPGVPPTVVPSRSNKTESVAGPSSNSKELKTMGHSSEDICDPNQIDLSKETVAMLMGTEMRKMFFAAGLFLVEGETDKRFLTILRQSMLEHAIKIRAESSNPGDLLQALQILEMDHWDILTIGGCGNAVKAYKAASDLKIPCAVILDEDTITVKRGKILEPFSPENWKKSRLHKELQKVKSSFDTASTLIEEIKTQPGDPRTVLMKLGIWVWKGDLENALLENSESIKEIESFKNFLFEEFSLSLDNVSDIGRSERPLDVAVKDFEEKVETPIEDQMVKLKEKLCKAKEKRNENGTVPVTNDLVSVIQDIGQLKQRLKQHDKFCSPNASKEELWEKIKSKMHAEAGWAKIPWETLLELIETSLKDESSQVSNFCKFMKQHQLRAKPRKKELPQDLFARVLESVDVGYNNF